AALDLVDRDRGESLELDAFDHEVLVDLDGHDEGSRVIGGDFWGAELDPGEPAQAHDAAAALAVDADHPDERPLLVFPLLGDVLGEGIRGNRRREEEY